jgi:hypothetical protein
MEPPFAHPTHTMVKSPIKEIDDGQYSADHYKFISWKPKTLSSLSAKSILAGEKL